MAKRSKGKAKNKQSSISGGIKYTVCAEFFPDPLIAADPKCREGETPVDTEARLFDACERWALNRLLEGKTREGLKKRGQPLFGLNSRRVDDAILKAQALIDSQKELLPLEMEETQSKLARAKKKLAHAEKDLKKARQENDSESIARAKRVVHSRRMRVGRLAGKLAILMKHQAAGTIPNIGHPPKVGRGGRALWKRVCTGQATNKEWRAARQNHLYARGDKSKDGNPTIRIAFQDGEFRLAVTISHLSEEKGVDKLGRPVMTRAPQVEGKLWIPEKQRLRVWELLLSGAEYTVELIKGVEGRYRAHISFTVDAPSVTTNENQGILGVDTNPDGVALANVSYTGQPEAWPEGLRIPYPKALHKFEGELQIIVHPNGFLYLKVPELAYSSGFRRTYLIGVLAMVVVEIAKSLGKPLAVERLDFGKGRLDTNRRFNRMAANFPFKKVIEAVIRKAFREGVGVKLVWPAHTSTIGHWKYQQRYGVSVHHAAALVIARRAIGFRERITKELREKVLVLKKNLAKVYSQPKEGKGMIRKARRLFKRLDGKIMAHNGLRSFKQESFHSVWSDLKRLSWSSR
ncbi:MAG TPA: transposase [Spirochaetia bacterium]|nr:transposase [Spirochaetia bacterium]